MEYTVYLLRCADGTYYTGSTNNLARRLRAHNAGRGAKYTRSRRPVQVVYQEQCPDRSAALRREYALKQLTHQQKAQLAQSDPGAAPPLSEQENTI